MGSRGSSSGAGGGGRARGARVVAENGEYVKLMSGGGFKEERGTIVDAGNGSFDERYAVGKVYDGKYNITHVASGMSIGDVNAKSAGSRAIMRYINQKNATIQNMRVNRQAEYTRMTQRMSDYLNSGSERDYMPTGWEARYLRTGRY